MYLVDHALAQIREQVHGVLASLTLVFPVWVARGGIGTGQSPPAEVGGIANVLYCSFLLVC